MKTTVYLHEIFSMIKSATREQKIQILRKYDCPAMRMILKYGLGENVVFYRKSLPEYKNDSPIGLSYSNLYIEYKKLYMFLESQNIKVEKKNQLITELCESINQGEVEILKALFSRKFKQYSSLSLEIVEEALGKI